MHPVLARLGRLALYLTAWVPLAGLLVFLMTGPGILSWQEALAVMLPLCLVYAFVSLATWYPCRRLPLRQTGVLTLLVSHAAAAAAASTLWVMTGFAWAQGLSGMAVFQELDQRLEPQLPLLFGFGVLIYLLSVAFHYLLLAVAASREAERREMQAHALAREAELKALKAQINPHFLFNSLNSISALTSLDPARARQMCVLLAEFLRSTLGLGEKTSIPLEEELALARCFLAVEKVRFGARLRVEEDVQEQCRSRPIPPLLLQPLIENAVNHGIARLAEGGWIRLEARCADGRLVIVLENAIDPEAPAGRSNGMGLANVRRRLEARYGDEARLEAGAAGDRYRVRLSLPGGTEAEVP